MAQKSISQLDTIAQAHDTDLFEVAAVDAQSASGYKSGKMSAEVMAEGLLSTYTYPTAMPQMQNKTITGALNQLLANFAPAYDDTQTYSAGDVCTYNGQLYRANTDIDTPEAFDIANWDAGTAADFFEGGGNPEIKTVLQAYAASNGQDETIPRTQWDENDYDSAYFSWDSTTHKWTVEKDFDGVIFLVIRNYQTASNPSMNVCAFIDNTAVIDISTTSTTVGEIAFGTYSASFTAGQTVYVGKNSGKGWEAPYIYITEGDPRISLEEVGQISIDDNYGSQELIKRITTYSAN